VLMELNEALVAELNFALNEARWWYAEVLHGRRIVDLGFQVLSLPATGPEPDLKARSIRIHVRGVGRIAASLRLGRWDDDEATVELFNLESLNEVVERFGGSPIYGWEFFDSPDKSWNHWKDRLSLDVSFEYGSDRHVVDLFQESAVGGDRHLDVRIWFNDLAIFDYEMNQIPTEEFAAGGRRWWDALYAGDPRTEGHGIFPLKPDEH